MNGRKYGHNYAARAHGFNLRVKAFPVSYYAPKGHYPLREMLWYNLMNRMKRISGGGCPSELWSRDGRVRKVCWGKTLGWWERRED